MNYHRLTIEEHSCIPKYYVDGLSCRKIAQLIGALVFKFFLMLLGFFFLPYGLKTTLLIPSLESLLVFYQSFIFNTITYLY